MFENKKDLSTLTTFHVSSFAEYFTSVTSIEQLKTVLTSSRKLGKNIKILGSGSNVLFTKNFMGLLIHNCIEGISLSENDSYTNVTVNAGVEWHSFVTFCIENNLGGIENLALIPGKCGAAPIQNIGAYGVELADVLISVSVLDIDTLQDYSLSNSECKFGYRDSIFKNELFGKCVITSITLQLSNSHHAINYNYKDVAVELENQSITKPSIKDIFSAVVSIRKRKLPDPNVLGNAGSFFKNPIISNIEFKRLQIEFPTLPSYFVDEKTVKIAAAYLIETVGMKGVTIGNVGTHKNQPLVLVNYGNGTGQEILELSKIIIEKVQNTFGIRLHTEVNIW